jgi:hypothetical protein
MARKTVFYVSVRRFILLRDLNSTKRLSCLLVLCLDSHIISERRKKVLYWGHSLQQLPTIVISYGRTSLEPRGNLEL